MAHAREACAQAGVAVEIVAVLDRPDDETRAVLESWQCAPGLLEPIVVDHGDPGLTRNAGVSRASGAMIAIVDGDDLVSRDWLLSAYQMLSGGDPRWVLHPEINFHFGTREHWWRSPEQDEPGLCPGNLIYWNYWSALAFARREVFDEILYEACPPGSGFGFEDWHWTTRVIATGRVHRRVPGTAHFLRAKTRTASLVARHHDEGAVLRPSPFFEPGRFSQMARLPERTRPPRTMPGVSRLRPLYAFARALDLAASDFVVGEAPPRVARGLQSLRGAILAALTPGLRAGLPEWMVTTLADAAQFEPALRPDADLLARTAPLPLPWRTGQAEAYGRLSAAVCAPSPSHLLLAAAPEAAAAVEVATSLGPAAEAVVLVEGEGPPVVAPAVRVVRLQELTEGLHRDEVTNVLVRLCLQAHPAVIHNFESTQGWSVIVRHGGCLAGLGIALYASVQAPVSAGVDPTHVRHLTPSWRHLTGLLSTSDDYLACLATTLGVTAKLVLVSGATEPSRGREWNAVRAVADLPGYVPGVAPRRAEERGS